MYRFLLVMGLMMKTVKKGKYLHFKGGEYEVLGVAKHSEKLEDLVVYICKHKDSFGRVNGLWVRPAAMFLEQVEVGGKKMPRFKYLGPAKESSHEIIR